MFKRPFLMFWMLMMVLLLSAGCSQETARTEKFLYINSQEVPCVGVGPRMCLQVKEAKEAEWELWYDAIEGFTFEEGFLYTIRVEMREVKNPPADASSKAYRLIAILQKQAVSH